MEKKKSHTTQKTVGLVLFVGVAAGATIIYLNNNPGPEVRNVDWDVIYR